MDITLAIVVGVVTAVFAIRGIDAMAHILNVRRETLRVEALRADAAADPWSDAAFQLDRIGAEPAPVAAPVEACIWCDSTELGHDWTKCEW